jgi:hypothetical protein
MSLRYSGLLSLAAAVTLLSRPAGADDAAQPSSVTHEQQLLAEGHRLSDAGKFCEAWQLYDEVVRARDTPSAAALFATGRAARKAELWDQAIAALQRFLDAASDEGARKLAQKWLTEAQAGVARCRIELDPSAPIDLALEAEAIPPPGGGSSCHHNRLVRVDRGQTALLNLGWRYELRGRADGEPLRPLAVRAVPGIPSVATELAGIRSDAVELARDACVLSFARQPPAPAALQQTNGASDDPPPASSPDAVVPHSPRAASDDRNRVQATIPTLSYIVWGGAAVAAAGMTVALIERKVEIDRWNSEQCVREGMTRAQSCSEHRDNYQAASRLALGTGIAAAVLAATGIVIWWLEPGRDGQAAALVCAPGLGPSAACTTRF